MGWKVLINATEVGIVDKITEELNGHEEALVNLPNTAANRTLIGTDEDITIIWVHNAVEDTVFSGTLTGAPEYTRPLLKTVSYNKCWEIMARKLFGYPDPIEYEETAANTVFAAICAAAGVTPGVCPADLVSVRFYGATCLDAVFFLAESVNKDIWSSDTTVNIGDRGAAKGAITVVGEPKRGKDRAKKRNRVLVRGTDVDGNVIYGEAKSIGWTSETDRPVVLNEKKASDTATLDRIAARKLIDYEKDSSGVMLPISPDVGYAIFPGDVVTLNDAALELVGDFKIWKIVRKLAITELHADRETGDIDKAISDLKKYEDLGIYLPPISKGSQGWNSNIVFSPGPNANDSIAWTAGTVYFADGSTQAITTAGSPIYGLSIGVHYLYWLLGTTTMQETTTYSDAIGLDKGLLAKVIVSDDGSVTITIETLFALGTGFSHTDMADIGANDHHAMFTSGQHAGIEHLASMMAIEQRKWTSNFNVSWDGVHEVGHYNDLDYGKAGTEDTDDANISFTGGPEDHINQLSVNDVPDGLWYLYWDENFRTLDNYDVKRTDDILVAVGVGKGLLATVLVDEAGENPPCVQCWGGYTPTVSAGMMAARFIDAGMLKAEFVIGTEQIKTGAGVQWAPGGDPGVIITGTGLRGKGAAGALMVELLATNGKITAAGGDVILDDDGVTIKGQTLTFIDDATLYGFIRGHAVTGALVIGAFEDLKLSVAAGKDIDIGGATVTLDVAGARLVIPTRTVDPPSPRSGEVWLRTDL